jgi:cell division protein FtsB
MNGCESRFRCPIRKIFVDVVAADEMIVDLRRDINRLKAREKQLLERARKLRKQLEEKGDTDYEVKADIRD